jgi:perosamine synthetase
MKRATKYPVALPTLTDVEEAFALDAVKSGWISSHGPYIERFESEFGAKVDAGYTVATNTGTAALHLALVASGVGPGDEVIVPALTYIATANAVTYCGAKPVFVDVDPLTWCIDVEEVSARITSRTRAIVAVDLYGHPADYLSLRKIADSSGLTLLADAAESFGASFRGESVGSLADFSAFSFFGNKVLTSGEGGCITTNDDASAERIRVLRNQGMDPDRRYFFREVGFNYRMTNVAAAILCAQLQRSEHILRRRREIVSRYETRLGSHPMIETQTPGADVFRSPWMATVLIESRKDACLVQERKSARDLVAEALGREGVETRPFFVPIPDLPCYGHASGPFPVSRDLASRGLNLPTYFDLSDSDVDEICELLLSSLDSIPAV